MSSQDQRNEIILQCMPELIKNLTGLQDGDPNMDNCVQFAFNILRNHRNLSTNSHDVRRRIDGIKERFCVENCPEYAEYLQKLCDQVVQHPLCIKHYEVDVHWSLLDFLFSLAYNPSVALKKNKHDIAIEYYAEEEDTPNDDSEKLYWKSILKEDFIEVPRYESSDSELSDWSEHDDSSSNVLATVSEEKLLPLDEQKSLTSLQPSICKELKPPQKASPFYEFNSDNATEKLKDMVQHSWWLEAGRSGSNYNASVESKDEQANFCLLYHKFLSESTNNLIPIKKPSTILEQHVLREIIWMFHSPLECTVFALTEDNHLKVKEDISIPSCGVTAFKAYVEGEFLPYIKMMNALQLFHRNIYKSDDHRVPPRTLECYASNLHLHLKSIWQDLLRFEERLIVQKDYEINTLISMRTFLDPSFRHLTTLFDIHQQAILNWRQQPAHICSAFLLSSLINYFQQETDIDRGNLAISLLLASIKVFCEIIDTWWMAGRLDDWQQEYIVERINNTDQSVCMREYSKNKEKSFFVPAHVSNIILDNRLFELIKEYSLEAGRTLNLLYEINRIGDLQNNYDLIEGRLYNVFIEDYLKQVQVFQKELHGDSVATCDKIPKEDSGFCNDGLLRNSPSPASNAVVVSKSAHSETNHNSLLSHLTTQDDFLLMAFALNINEEDDNEIGECNSLTESSTQHNGLHNKQDINALTIYETLKKSTCILPLEEILMKSLTRILKQRIAFANNFVMKLYTEEFMILKHLQNIRKVLLLEASDLMHQFYSKLFHQIETGETWASSSLLTMQLDDIISAKFPEMSSLFRVEINSMFRCRTNKVFEAVEELVVTYHFNRELSHIITPDDIASYNRVFSFLLKVKWGITTLEKLRFPRSHKIRMPFAPFEMIDLIMRRLEQLRFWMIYAIQSIHFHLMTHVLQSMGEQVDLEIEKCENLKEMEAVHKSYLSTVCEHCFLVESLKSIKFGVEQLLSLVCILRLEWLNCVKYIESNTPLAIDLDDSCATDDDYSDADYVTNSQIDAVELTYIRCHQYLANILNNEVYLNKKAFLSGLSAAFNNSLPY